MTAPSDFTDVLTTALTWCFAGASIWLAAITALCFTEGLLTGSIDRFGRLAPAAVGRLVHLVLGISVAAAPVLLATTAEGMVPPPDAPPPPPAAQALLGLPLPERPMTTPGPAPVLRVEQDARSGAQPQGARPPGARPPGAAPMTPTTSPAPIESAAVRSVVVHTGDCLWAIAQREGVSWPALYRLNRRAIGPEPDLIHPGLRLRLPTSGEPR